MSGSGILARLSLIIIAFQVAPLSPARSEALASTPLGVTLTTCTVGEIHAPNITLNTIDLTGLIAYQLLDPAECAACSGGPLYLTEVAWRFKYYQTQCPLTFEVSVVGTNGSACPTPDTMKVLCGPVSFTYASTGDPSPTVVIPMPPGCCIAGPAFVCVKLTDTGGCGLNTLGFFAYAPGTCVMCRSYASLPAYPLEDSCDIFGFTPTITVGADCCTATPARRHTWGRTKLLYR